MFFCEIIFCASIAKFLWVGIKLVFAIRGAQVYLFASNLRYMLGCLLIYHHFTFHAMTKRRQLGELPLNEALLSS